MGTIARAADGPQALREVRDRGSEASANGGVLLLIQAWAMLGGEGVLAAGVRWQGQAGALLGLALVILPVVGATSVLAITTLTMTADVLWRVLGWQQVLTQRRLARFVGSGRHDWLGVYRAMMQQLGQHPATALDPSAPAAVVVDSFTIEKRYGPKLPGIRPVYDAVQRKLVDGYEVVSAAVVSAQQSWPVGLVPHQKSVVATERAKQRRRRRKAQPGELPSKLDVALSLVGVTLAAEVGGHLTVVGDSGFAVMWWLREIAALGLPWLVSTRQDRRLRIGTVIAPFRVWASGGGLTGVAVDDHGAGIWGAILPLATLLDKGCNQKGLPCQPIYFERRDRRGKVVHRWYLVTSHLDWDLTTTWQHWGWRWQIEVWHRTWKQQLQATQFHVRSWPGIVTWLACSSLRAGLLVFLQAVEPAYQAYSLEALVNALGRAACLVEVGDARPAQVDPPTTLPPTRLWRDQQPPLPPQWWPITLNVA